MRFGKVWAVVLLWLGCGLAAQAQFGAYGLFSATSLTGIQCLSPLPTACSNGAVGGTASGSKVINGGFGKVNPTGLSGGVYYDFKSFGRVRLGVDVRGGNFHANKSASTSAGGSSITSGSYFLAGIRGTIRTPITWLKPYAQVSAGYSHNDATEPINAFSPVNGSSTPPRYFDGFLQYEGFIGADIKVLPMVDLRAIELGVGNMNRLGSGSGLGGTSSVGVRSIGAGVVFHLPGK